MVPIVKHVMYIYMSIDVVVLHYTKWLLLLLPLLSSYVCLSFTTTLNNSVVQASSPSNRRELSFNTRCSLSCCVWLFLVSMITVKEEEFLKNCYFDTVCSSSSSSSTTTFSTPLLLGSYSLLIIDILQCRRMATNVVRVSGF